MLLMKRDFLALNSLTSDTVTRLLDSAQVFSRAFTDRSMPQLLAGKSVAIWFPDSGFRNRVAFDLGVQLMGGKVTHVPGELGEREDPADVGAYLSNWFDAIVVRAPDIARVRELARGASIPVINGRTSHNHPCEILGDLAFIQSARGSLSGLQVAFVGPAGNICHSWFEASATLPIHVTQVCPPGFEASETFLSELRESAAGEMTTTPDIYGALKHADVICTDTWPGGIPEIADQFRPYQITAEILAPIPQECLFLPCPPVHRGEEVDAGAMMDPRCRVTQAKAFLLHAQNALLAELTDA